MSGPHYVVVFGGRDFDDEDRVRRMLKFLVAFYGDVRVLHGDAAGADRLAARVAEEMGLRVKAYPADWSGPCEDGVCASGHRRQRAGGSYCPAAGVRRNRLMANTLCRWRAQGVSVSAIGFPGSSGTADMRRVCEELELPVSDG